MSTKKASPDELLAPEQFPGMNKAFYATRPWSYFRHRERLLVLAAGASGELIEIARKEVKVGRLAYTADGENPGPHDDENREQFIFAESEVLLHHVSETLLRLYLAHEGAPPCPWLEIARVRGAGQFKRMVSERFAGGLSPEDRRQRVGQVSSVQASAPLSSRTLRQTDGRRASTTSRPFSLTTHATSSTPTSTTR